MVGNIQRAFGQITAFNDLKLVFFYALKYVVQTERGYVNFVQKSKPSVLQQKQNHAWIDIGFMRMCMIMNMCMLSSAKSLVN